MQMRPRPNAAMLFIAWIVTVNSRTPELPKDLAFVQLSSCQGYPAAGLCRRTVTFALPTAHNSRSSLSHRRQSTAASFRSLCMKDPSWVDTALDFVFRSKLNADVAAFQTLNGDSEEFELLVLDDDSHSVDEVVRIFRTTLGCSWQTSLDYALKAGKDGSVVVFRGSREACEKAQSMFSKERISAKVRDPNQPRESIEPAKDESRAIAPAAPKSKWKRPFKNGDRPKVTVIGGTGRVGMWTCRELLKFAAGDIDFVIAGRNKEAGKKIALQLSGHTFVFGGRDWATIRTKHLGTTEFKQVSLQDRASILEAISSSDLVIHTAGPFQGGEPSVLAAAIEAGTAYMDVCDDGAYSGKCRQLRKAAEANGVAAITTCGIYPGVSNIMAAVLVRQLRAQGYSPDTVKFSYFTAGTGGVGATILASTFLLLSEDAVFLQDGRRRELPALSLKDQADFGRRIGKRKTMLLNLPEVLSLHEVLSVPNVSAFFGTAPEFWNTLLEAIAKYIPRTLLSDRRFAQAFALVSLPINRVVDAFVGQSAGIRIDASAGTVDSSALWSHLHLSQAVGIATAAMAMEMLERDITPGVHFPEEIISDQARAEVFLTRASKGAIDTPFNFTSTARP